MAKRSYPRSGSLQFWPRKRARKFIPSVNWEALSGTGLLGFIAYKVGMKTAYVKDLTPNSMTKDKKIFIPVTVLEIPPMKIFSIRLYKNGIVAKDIILESEKEMKKIVKLPKAIQKKDWEKEDFDFLHVIAYSLVKRTGIKKTPDIAEIALGGNKEEQIKFAKEHEGKEIYASDFLNDKKIIDIRGLTIGKGLQGPVKRFGIGLKFHKSEKGQRRPGSLGPWHPARVTFRVSQAGQMGMFTRIIYNVSIVKHGKISEKNINPKSGFKHFGNIKTEFLILRGSVQGPSKRQLLLTASLRKTRKQEKKSFEIMKLV